MSLPDDKWLLFFVTISAFIHVASVFLIWVLGKRLNEFGLWTSKRIDSLNINVDRLRYEAGKFAAKVSDLETHVYEKDNDEDV